MDVDPRVGQRVDDLCDHPGGVRKRMVFAFTHPADAITWVAIARITP